MNKEKYHSFFYAGLSGECLDEQGHFWVGMDISPSMLEVAVEREVEGNA